jgi:predicted GH43/DUF377 family glycosyl hydrolase
MIKIPFDQLHWEKLGLIFQPKGRNGWDLHSALTPTPFELNDRIRVYAGFRDENGVSRIGYADLNKEDPTEVIGVSQKPVLDIGLPGTFDDNGVILGDVIRDNNLIKMYYVGFQLVSKVKFLAYTGLAVSEDGESFQRHANVPVLDRKENALYFNAVHTALKTESGYKFWLGAGSEWQLINETPYPSYNVKYIESNDGVTFNEPSIECLRFSSSEEYRIGRPKVYYLDSIYHMIFTWGDKQGNYRMGYAISKDGKKWDRKDEKINFHPSKNGWDNKWVSYGALFYVNGKTYMVYNGNEMGKDGFGLAVLKK